LFERSWVDNTNDSVTFEIWKKRKTNETVS
jgi:hypothetical protein